MFATLHTLELQWIEALHTIRSPWLDTIMMLLDGVDSAPFWIGLTLCILFLYNHTYGIRMLFLIVLSFIINQDLKVLFHQPRPVHLQSELGLISLDSFGFPSGAAQTSVVLFGFLAITLKKQWLSWLALFCILLVSFSRVYLGVHFISDIIGGWTFGGLLLAGYLYTLPSIERLIDRSSKRSLYLLSALSCGALVLLSITSHGISTAIFELGICLGLIWAYPFYLPKKCSHKWIQLLMAFGGIILVTYIHKIMPHILILSWLIAFFSGIWITWGTFYLSRKTLTSHNST